MWVAKDSINASAKWFIYFMFVNLTHLNEDVFVSGARFVKSNNHIVYTTNVVTEAMMSPHLVLRDLAGRFVPHPCLVISTPRCAKQQQPIKQRFHALNCLLAFVEVWIEEWQHCSSSLLVRFLTFLDFAYVVTTIGLAPNLLIGKRVWCH